jgi:hypothetical protein
MDFPLRPFHNFTEANPDLVITFNKTVMNKYRIEFDNFQIKGIHLTEQEVPSNDTILEEHTGDTIYAIIHAENDESAREKAERLAIELKTGERINK